jgi:hypothetical protein
MDAKGSARTPSDAHLAPISRKEFYALAFQLRDYAGELASHDPRRVVLKECHRFNRWLSDLRRHRELSPILADVRNARPVARWQVMALYAVVWGIVYLWSIGRVEGMTQLLLLNGMAIGFIGFIFIPEGVYGTTIEEIEGRVLRVVQAMEAMLAREEIQFTEGAFYKVREALKQAHYELREQLDLAHRN